MLEFLLRVMTAGRGSGPCANSKHHSPVHWDGERAVSVHPGLTLTQVSAKQKCARHISPSTTS